MFKKMLGTVAAGATALSLMAGTALGAQPLPWQIDLQPAASPVMERIESFHTLLVWLIVAISLFVLLLLVIVAVRFRSGANPVPSKTHHNTLLEVAWTLIPVLILVAIAIPSFKLLYFEETLPKADVTVKVIGKQWYWTYQYPADGNFQFDSLGLSEADAKKAGKPRLLGVDNAVYVPVNKNIVIQTTGADVIHSWAVPAFGVKMDAVPGRINHTWFRAERTGIYFGQCSELCGKSHAYMPIEVHVVTQAEYDAWLAQAKTKFASIDGRNAKTRFASASQ
jgi:cytochrome c oxidase subunit 2